MSTTPQTLDVTGLPPAAVAAVVEQLRAVQTRRPPTPEGIAERLAKFDAWAATRVRRNPDMDDSRESMYD